MTCRLCRPQRHTLRRHAGLALLHAVTRLARR